MSRCSRVRDLIGPLLYGDLSGTERRWVEAHLAQCVACRSEADAVRTLVTRAPADLVEMPAGAEERILEGVRRRLAQRAHRPSHDSARLPRVRPSFRLAWALAAAAAVVVAAFALRNAPRRPPVTTTHPAQGQPLFTLITVRGEARDGAGRTLKVGDQLPAGAVVRTGKAAYLVMVTRQGSGLTVDASSELHLAADGRSAALLKGQVYCRNRKREFAAVTTPAGQIHLLGTAINAAVKQQDRVAVTVVEGRVKLANAHGEAMVPAGRKTLLIASAAPDSGVAADVLAETTWVEGTLYFTYQERMRPGDESPMERIALTGSVQTKEGLPSSDADRSPGGDAIVWSDAEAQSPRPTRATLYVARADGGVTDLGARAGLTGVNCKPKWSPDARMIAFQHCDAATDQPACQEGFSPWVMNDDGSNPHTLAPVGMAPSTGLAWFPDGVHLLVETSGGLEYRVSVATQEWVKLPVLMGEPTWSPDGRHLAYTAPVPGVRDGKRGIWHQLVLADALGGHPRVLVQQFLADAEIARHYPTAEQKKLDPKVDWLADLQYHVGPAEPQWSPSGDQIAFRAALPFDPAGPYYREQVQIWIYDLNADKLVQVTYEGAHYSLVWSASKLPVSKRHAGGSTPGTSGTAH